MSEILGFVFFGFVAGSISASLGIGGGVVLVPALVILFSFDQHLAQGTSLAVIVPTAIVGAVVHARASRVIWRFALPLGIVGILGGLLGGRLALALDDLLLRRLFAALLFITAVRMITLSGGGRDQNAA